MRTIFAVILAMSISTAALAAESATSPTARAPANSQSQLIDQIITTSGMKKSLDRLPAQIAAGFMQSAIRSGADADEGMELANTLEKAFPQDVFINHVSAAMKKNYDGQRYTHFLQLLSTPLAKRMLELEAQEPKPADVQAFLSQAAQHPLPPERIKLIQRMDAATQSSTMLTTMMVASLEAGALAAGNDCSVAASKTKKSIEKSQPEIEKTNRSNVQVMLAFTYRGVSDADLDTYLKSYEDKDSRWVLDIVQTAINEQFKSSVGMGAQGMKKVIQAHKRKKTMFAPKCGQSESPSADEVRDDEIAKENPVKVEAVKAPTRKAVTPERTVAEPDSKAATPDKPTTEQQVVRQPDTNAAVPVKIIAAVSKPADNVHHYPARGRDLRECLNLATPVEIIACSEK